MNKTKFMLAFLFLLIFTTDLFSNSRNISVEELSKTVVLLKYQTKVYERRGNKQVEVWYKKNPEKEEYEQKLNVIRGTGFIVKYNNRDYIVTAKHVAESMPKSAEIAMNNASGEEITVTFEILESRREIKGAKWFFHPSADVAVHPIAYPQSVDHVSIPIELCSKGDKALPLLSKVYILGFPFGIGEQGHLCPIAKETRLASWFTAIDMPGIDPQLRFVLLDQALAQGYSGSPIFCIEEVMSDILKLGNESVIKAGEKVSVIGVMSSQLLDQAGGKISLVVPTMYMWEIFSSQDFISYEKHLK